MRLNRFRNIAQKSHHNGQIFHSRLEMRLFQQLELLQSLGELTDIRRQVRVPMTLAKIVYVADFQATSLKTGETYYLEAKGVETETWKLKLRLFRRYGDKKLEIYKENSRGLYLHEIVIPH